MKCLVLFSGGLDSMLAAKLMLDQGLEVEAINFKTVFTCCQTASAKAAHELGIRLNILEADDSYLTLIRKPMFGYGKGANPCIDCRIDMFRRATKLLEPLGASFLVSGEILGQRPKSQKRRDLEIIAHHGDCEDLLLRPLSAKLLPPTLPEREKWVDREKLFDFTGQSRKGLIALANSFGWSDLPTPSNGCALTEVGFSRKVFDLFENAPRAERKDYELLRIGRHFRFDPAVKIIVGRNHGENESLAEIATHSFPESSLLRAVNFMGPSALVLGPYDANALQYAAALILRFGKEIPQEPLVERFTGGVLSETLAASRLAEAMSAVTLGSEA